MKRGYEAELHGERAVFTEGFDYINHRDEVKRVLILDRSVPTYHSDKDYVKPFGRWGERPYPGVNTVADILPRVTQMGITHVFDLQSEIAGYQVPSDYPGLVLTLEASGQRVYRVVSSK